MGLKHYLTAWCSHGTEFVSALCFAALLGLAKGVNVALHAQVPPDSGVVVGSAVTMAGLQRAFEMFSESSHARNTSGGLEIAQVEVFYPFNYVGLHDRQWDLVIIEGWFKMINAFIHEVRAISHPQHVRVIFYCLDPEFPGLPHLTALDVDGFLTNSEFTRVILSQFAPTELMILAVDQEKFRFFPDPPLPAISQMRGAAGESNDGRVVYVGAAGALRYKQMLAWMLREAVPYGLDIYGSGWQDIPEFSGFWRGVLPEAELASVYGKALVVIGVTMDAQRESGMINNRVFEALSVGAPLISDHFRALEALFGDLILYVQSPGDVARHIERLVEGSIGDGSSEGETIRRTQRRAFVEEWHTWERRVEQLVPFAASLPNGTSAKNGNRASGCWRAGCQRLAVVIDPELRGDITFESTFPAAVNRLRSMYRVDWWQVEGEHETRPYNRGDDKNVSSHDKEWAIFRQRQLSDPEDNAAHLKDYDIVWAVGPWGGRADSSVRHGLESDTAFKPRTRTPRLGAQLRGLVLWGMDSAPKIESLASEKRGNGGGQCSDVSEKTRLHWYDVVYCQTSLDYAHLRRLEFEGAISNNLQQAWGFGPSARRPDNGKLGEGGMPATYDILVAGTHSQIQDMLAHLQDPGLARVALAIVLSPNRRHIETETEFLSLLTMAGVFPNKEESQTLNLDKLPEKLSLYVVDAAGAPSIPPRPIDIFLIRGEAGAFVLAETAGVAARTILMAGGDLGAWAALVIAAQGRMAPENVQVAHGSGIRAQALVGERPKSWNVEYYSRRLIAGMTRALCLGRGNSHISLVTPAAGSTRVVAPGDTVAVRVLVYDFEVGRDGQWCVTAAARTLLCVLRDHMDVSVEITSSLTGEDGYQGAFNMTGLRAKQDLGANGTATAAQDLLPVNLKVELRSNIYRDVLHRSSSATLLVDLARTRTHGDDACMSASGTVAGCLSPGPDADHDQARNSSHRHEAFRTSLDIKDFMPASIPV